MLPLWLYNDTREIISYLAMNQTSCGSLDKVFGIYGKQHISERHRHRYEFNNAYLKDYESAGLIPSGMNPDNGLVEIVELKNHPFFVGSQFHPELKSTVANPHPLFINFVAASLAYARKK